jgi:predicted nucleic acid-binding protein
MRVVVDSNVLVDALLPSEYIENRKRERANKSKNFWMAVLEGKHEVVVPAIGLIEVCARLSRVMRDKNLALDAPKVIAENAAVVYQDEDFVNNFIPEIVKIDYKGADAIFSAIAKRLNLKLLTSDKDLYEYLCKENKTLGVNALFLEEVSDTQIEGTGD